MVLNIFFITKEERIYFLKKYFEKSEITIDENKVTAHEISGIKSIKFKNKFKNIPGYWLEIKFQYDDQGKDLYNKIIDMVDPTRINNNVFYPRVNVNSQELQEGWLHKYNFLNTEGEDGWKLFFQEIKSHIKHNRIDIAYKGLALIFKYNPFFLKKYKRHNILEDIAYAYEDVGNIGKAIKALKMQAVLKPESIEPYLNMSSFYIINGMEEEAFNTCKMALKKNPQNQYLVSNLIIALINIGSYEYAVNFLRKELDKQPNNAYYWKLMGDIFYELEKNKGALDCYFKALKLSDSSFMDDFKIEVYTGIGDCYNEEKNHKEAVAYYKKALKYDTKDAYLLLTLGQIYWFALKELKLSYKYTKLLVDSAPENGYGQYQLGLIYAQLEHVEKAKWHLYKARSIIPYYKPVHDAIQLLKSNKKRSSR